MKAHLLHPDRDFDWSAPPPWNAPELAVDLALNTLFDAMAQGDERILEAVKKVIFAGVSNDLKTINYRQSVLQDCLKQSSIVRELYAITVEAAETERKHWLGTLARYPNFVLRHSVDMMEEFIGLLKKLRAVADTHALTFESVGWTEFFLLLQRDLGEDYFAHVGNYLKELRLYDGVRMSAELGKGNKGNRYILHQPPHQKRSWLAWMFPPKTSVYSFELHPRDEMGAKALDELQSRGISLAARAIGQSVDHVQDFFSMLRSELAFYVGCINLHEQLAKNGEPVCLPKPVTAEELRFSFRGLYDVCLTLGLGQRVVGNDANGDGKNLLIVTGANQGGKSTFLRSLGLAQLMMQAGMFVAAESFCANLSHGLFTHFKREEDTGMKSGKLDEELNRMSQIVDHIAPHAMILFNESFAATNEREGSEIAQQIVLALLENHIKIAFVTHLYELAHGFYERKEGNVLFLQAPRQADGVRTFKLIEGEPLPTSFGRDLYENIFHRAAS